MCISLVACCLSGFVVSFLCLLLMMAFIHAIFIINEDFHVA